MTLTSSAQQPPLQSCAASTTATRRAVVPSESRPPPTMAATPARALRLLFNLVASRPCSRGRHRAGVCSEGSSASLERRGETNLRRAFTTEANQAANELELILSSKPFREISYYCLFRLGSRWGFGLRTAPKLKAYGFPIRLGTTSPYSHSRGHRRRVTK